MKLFQYYISIPTRQGNNKMTTFTYETEILDGIHYISTTNARGTTTTIFEMSGTIFVGVNRSPVKALVDIKKPSKDVKNLLTIMEA